MNEPICFTHYFVNKQNVRSFSNILNPKLLKSENSKVFLNEIFKNEHLVSELSTELHELLSELQKNIKAYSQHDFRNYFTLDVKEQGLFVVDKKKVYESCWIAHSKIIPKQFFGNNHNAKLFKKCFKIIIYSMKRQYLDLEKLTKKWDLDIFPWSSITRQNSFQVIQLDHILKWIFKIILSSIIALNFYVTTCKINNDENLLYFFCKNRWQSFYDKKLSDMVTAKILFKSEINCLGKKVKQRYSLQEKIKLKLIKKETPKLYLVLKSNDEYRPIVRYKSDLLVGREKYKMKERLYFLKKLAGKPQERVEIQFASLYFRWLKRNKPKLYFIKTDLSNAFGSINRTKLLRILCERHLELQKTETCTYLKKKHAQHYKELVAEIRKPLLIRAGSTVYEWREGLVQGYKYSPALSELYYSYMDKIYFSKHQRNEQELKLFIRVVDDYLYITDTLEDAHSFLSALSNYRNVNYSKTVINFIHPTIRYSKEIVFLGYSYDTDNMHVGRANNVFTGDMCYKIVFSSATTNLVQFLENRIGQSGIQINTHIFNFNHNNEELIWEHIFVTLCLSANKFCTIIAILCEESEMAKYIAVYKKKVSVKLCNTIVETLKKNVTNDFMFIYCVNHFRYLSFKALLLCARKTPKCNILVPHINIELAKCNCIFGKWKEHARMICADGVYQKAIKEVCRKTDIRRIFKNLDELPRGFQCYDHRRFYQIIKEIK